MIAGFALLVVLSVLAAVAAVSVAVRGRFGGRAELALAAYLLWHVVAILPATLLGWINRLYPVTVALGAVAASAAAIAASTVGVGRRAHAREVARAAWSLVRLPYDGLRECYEQGSFAFFGVLASLGAMAWTAWLAYLAPSCSWDGMFYHESDVGFALQNHGFSTVNLPATMQNVNGMPRLVETVALWFVVFTDRRLIDVVNSLVAPMFMLGVYVIARRHAPGRLSPMGWAAAVFLIPGVILQLRSTYIDIHVAAFFLAALHFATRPQLRRRDVFMGGLALGMLMASKLFGMPWAVLIGAVALWRAIAHGRRAPAATAITVAGSTALMLAVGAPNYVRNWIVFHNPLYPTQLDFTLFGHAIHLPGTFDANVDRPLKQIWLDMVRPYAPGHDYADPRDWGYGMGFPFFVLPWAAGAAIALVIRAVAGWVRERPRDPAVENLLWVTLPIAASFPLSPQKWFARYNIHVVAGLAFLANWSGTRPRLARMSEGLAAVAIATSLMMLYWCDPGWSVTFDQAMMLARWTPEQRAAWEAIGYSISTQAAAARDRELGPGDVAVLSDSAVFPSLLWNEKFSNRVVWVPSGGDSFLRACDDLHAKWATGTPGSPELAALRGARDRWEEVGEMSMSPKWYAFRRKP
jgi:hypothetical protein